VARYESVLRRSERVAEGTFAFHFDKPAGFTHFAGQNATFELVDPPENDAEGPTRTFTLASAPFEPGIMIATRMRDPAFKRVLGSAPAGTRIRIDGPAGIMVLHDDDARTAVFLAGGIGITPFLSMIRQATHQRLAHRLLLFYSNRRPEDAAFLDEFRAGERENPRFRMVATMTEPEKSALPWRGETGYIRKELLARHLPDASRAIFYFAGPPAMTAAMQAMLEEAGVEEDAMRSEEFYGY
jgi:ferredoxin-NADP reductase